MAQLMYRTISHCHVPNMDTFDPRGVAKFDSRGMNGANHEEDYQPLLHVHTNYQSCGPCGFREEDYVFQLKCIFRQPFLLPSVAVCVILLWRY